MLTFSPKSKVWLITSINCSHKSYVDGRLAPLIATYITSKSVKLSILLWSLSLWPMASVTSLPTSFVMALMTPSCAPMTNWLMFLLCLLFLRWWQGGGQFYQLSLSIVCSFLCRFDHGSGRDGIGWFDNVRRLSLSLSSFPCPCQCCSDWTGWRARAECLFAVEGWHCACIARFRLFGGSISWSCPAHIASSRPVLCRMLPPWQLCSIVRLWLV